MLLLGKVELLLIDCVWVSLGWSLWVYESVSLAVVSTVLTSEDSAGGNDTMLTVGLIQSAILWLSVISLEFILPLMCVWCDGKTC